MLNSTFRYTYLNFSLLSKKYLLRVLIVTGVAFVVIGCGSEAVFSNQTVQSIPTITLKPSPKPTLPKDLTYRWLKSIPCAPPCFEGITPGQTNTSQALALLKQNPLVDKESVKQDPPASKGYGYLVWNWVGGKITTNDEWGTTGSMAQATNPAQTIILISPQLTTYKLKEVIQAFGEPSHIAATDETIPEGYPHTYVIKFVYLKQGFFVETKFSKLATSSADDEVSSPTFFMPGPEGFAKFTSSFIPVLLPWQGHKPFDFYCRSSNGKPCGRLPPTP